MFLTSALPAVSRASHLRRSQSPSNLGLGRSPPGLPAGWEEFTADFDLFVAGLVDTARVLSSLRPEVCDVMSSVRLASAPQGTVLTHETLLRDVVPRLAPRLGASVLTMTSEAYSRGIFVILFLVGPRRPSPAASQPAARWSLVKQVTAAALYRHMVRGIRAVSEEGWHPLTGAFWTSMKKVPFCCRICVVLPILPPLV